jgi:hypothetical protein
VQGVDGTYVWTQYAGCESASLYGDRLLRKILPGVAAEHLRTNVPDAGRILFGVRVTDSGMEVRAFTGPLAPLFLRLFKRWRKGLT